jgi:hypothetical protein
MPPVRSRLNLPSGRRSSPWRLAVVALCVGVVVVGIPLWVDPGTINTILGKAATPLPSPVPLETDGFRPATNAPILRSDVIAADDFFRQIPTGFGTAKQGGDYKQVGNGTIWVQGAKGEVSLADGSFGAAILAAESVATVGQQVTVDLASGAPSVEIGLAARANGDDFYAVVVTYLGGVASVSVESVVDGTWTTIAGPVQLREIDITQPLRLRFDSSGFDPTTIRVRAWNVGTPEPGQWTLNIVDWAGKLQKAGAIGIAWGISDERRGIVEIDDYVAQGD